MVEDIVYLNPVPPPGCGGSVEHYFHFLFDLLLPLYKLFQNTEKNIRFAIKDIGPFSNRLIDLYGDRIKIVSAGNWDTSHEMKLVGMNPNCVDLTTFDFTRFKREIFELAGVRQVQKASYILLIERLKPQSFYVTKAKLKGGGEQRRSIPNHDELIDIIKKEIGSKYEFHNIQLEKIHFNKQLEYFDKAICVIGQHGAGLGNFIWTKEGASLLEISHYRTMLNLFMKICMIKKGRYELFKKICMIKKGRYELFKTSGPHAKLNLKQFNIALKKTLGNINS